MEYFAGFMSGLALVVTGLMLWASWAMVEVEPDE